MNIADLGRLVYQAIEEDPPKRLEEYCGLYYDPYYYLLHLLARHTDKTCVELGVEKGRGSFAMALAEREVIGIDHTKRPEVNVLLQTFPTMTFLEQSSLPVPELVKGKTIGLLHVDTEHSFAQAREEFWAYKQFLVPGSVVCFDDTKAQEYQVANFINTLPWPTIFDHRLHSCGYAVMLYTGEV